MQHQANGGEKAAAKEIRVIKRNGSEEPLNLHAVFDRYATLLSQHPAGSRLEVDIMWLVGKTIAGIVSGMRTSGIDKLAEEICAHAGPSCVDYHDFAAAILTSCMHKDVPPGFLDAMDRFAASGATFGPSEDMLAFARRHADAVEAALRHELDYGYEYPSVYIADGSYALRLPDGTRGERIQHMYMRVSLGLCRRMGGEDAAGDIAAALRLYRLLAGRYVSLATPVLRTAGTNQEYMVSCFLMRVPDSIEGMYDKVREFAVASKRGGGMGMCVSDIRVHGSRIRSSGGLSKGVPEYLKVVDATRMHLQQGSNKRSAVGAPYLELWHGDVLDFLEINDRPQVVAQGAGRKKKAARCPNLFPGCWVPDLFWERYEHGQDWSLFCPDECPGLVDSYGDRFRELYEGYEAAGKARARIPAKALVQKMCEAQTLHGGPYVLNKDAVNACSNQQHEGTVSCANLCTEITQRCSFGAKACCVLGAVCLGAFAVPDPDADGKVGMDFAALVEASAFLATCVDAVNDLTGYPDEATRDAHLAHRSIGIGVCGLADVFAKLGIAWESDAARLVNHRTFESIHYGCLRASVGMARTRGPCAAFTGSPASFGFLQRDLCIDRRPDNDWLPLSPDLDWARLRADIIEHGQRNDLLTALMPTASTAALTGSNECFEPFTSNLYVRKLATGDLLFPNRHLMRLLRAKGKLDPETMADIVRADGSVQGLDCLDADEKAVFKTVWEIPQRRLVDLAADRQAFVDQSQSMNIWFANPTGKKLGSLHLYAWKRGLKTGLYYLHAKAATEMIAYDTRIRGPPRRKPDAAEAPNCDGGGCSL